MIAAGALLLLIACGMGLYFTWEDRNAAQTSAALLAQVTATDNTTNTTNTVLANQPHTDTDTRPILPEGCKVSGILSIPKLNLELPVLDECTDYLLKLSVCRYEGNAEGAPSKLIIAGHNYKSHFKTLSELAVGDTVTFTSLTGEVYSYTVSALEEIDGNDIDGLHQGDWDITLFTCNFDGGNRLLIRCRLI